MFLRYSVICNFWVKIKPDVLFRIKSEYKEAMEKLMRHGRKYKGKQQALQNRPEVCSS